ncbi:KTSC domain-containing protein [Flavobacterium orientale]|uniref:KTSC domain-containing protein n=1 Tax=Flavobacterium orientale TaxID=1756020 RepID=A0A916XW99_9FLAO|nr:KTSC domain-containing protein [Flavobacterium orientale]GGD17704.1 hypothetical protein GCM10011343_05530 [Flavobacterium orientale]
MERKSVRSSNLVSIGYDVNNKILEIEFHNGGVYQYSNVSFDVYEELMDAKSHGTYFSANIRNNTNYKTKKLK